MKRIIICLALVLCSMASMAQSWRLECAETERDDRHFEVFLYRAQDSLQGYYLGLDTPDRIPGSLITFDRFTEVCVYLGETLEEAELALLEMKELIDAEVGPMKDYKARMALGVDLNEMSTATCMVQKRFLCGHRLCFRFDHAGYTTENFVRKGDLRSLLFSLGVYRKLNPNEK